MIDQESRRERIAIKMDSHISEADAILQTDAELKASQPNENILRIQRLRERKKLDETAKRHKHSPRNYD